MCSIEDIAFVFRNRRTKLDQKSCQNHMPSNIACRIPSFRRFTHICCIALKIALLITEIVKAIAAVKTFRSRTRVIHSCFVLLFSNDDDCCSDPGDKRRVILQLRPRRIPSDFILKAKKRILKILSAPYEWENACFRRDHLRFILAAPTA